MMLSERLAERFRQSWNDPFLVAPDGRSLSYGQVLAQAQFLASEWSRAGARPGDAIVLAMPNGVAFLCCYISCMVGGFIAVPVNRELSKDDFNFIIELIRPAVVVDTSPAIDHARSPIGDFHLARDANTCGAIFFTSGTTGRPKGVRHSWAALAGNVAIFNSVMKIDASTRMYHVLPMTYMAGFLNTVLSPLVAGGAVIIGSRFNPQAALDFWSQPVRENANALWVTPSIASALARLARDHTAARHNARGLKTILCGTAPLHPAVRRKFREVFGVPLQESYGTSEQLLVSAQSRERAESMTADVGEPLPGLDCAFRRSAEGSDELVIRSPFTTLGYVIETGAVSADETDGFVATGDVGKLDQGVLEITGRLKDLVIRGGINISPRAIEDILCNLPGVEDVAVVGVPHEFWGEELVACIQVSFETDAAVVEMAARQRCGERLARAHQPDRISIFRTFPRAVTGKVQKGVLQRSLAR
jgi:long-chain acyl-CoA synthetase